MTSDATFESKTVDRKSCYASTIHAYSKAVHYAAYFAYLSTESVKRTSPFLSPDFSNHRGHLYLDRVAFAFSGNCSRDSVDLANGSVYDLSPNLLGLNLPST